MIRGLLSLGFLVFGLVLFFAFTFGTVQPAELGVRQINIKLPYDLGPDQGFSPVGLAPGVHWTIPYYSVIHKVPDTIRALHFDRDKALFPKSLGSLDVQSSDGATLDIDLSVLTRIYSAPAEKHGGPADLIRKMGMSPDSWDTTIRQVAEDELRRALGNLSSGDFYDVKKREEQVALAATNINTRLSGFGVKVEAVLLRRYTYRSDRINTAIFQKNLQDQEERLNEAASRFSEAKANLDQVEATWEAKIQTLRVEGQNKATVIRSEADLYEAKKHAEGDLLVVNANADVDKLRAQVFSQAGGSDNYIAKELAPLIASLRGGVVSDLDPYNLDAWMTKLGLGVIAGGNAGVSVGGKKTP